MFCSQCGKEMPDKNAFCTNCGAPLKQPVVQNAEETEHVEAEQTSVEQTTAPAEQTPVVQASVEQAPAEETTAPAEQTPAEQAMTPAADATVAAAAAAAFAVPNEVEKSAVEAPVAAVVSEAPAAPSSSPAATIFDAGQAPSTYASGATPAVQSGAGYGSGVTPAGSAYESGVTPAGAGYGSGITPATTGYGSGITPAGSGYGSGVTPAAAATKNTFFTDGKLKIIIAVAALVALAALGVILANTMGKSSVAVEAKPTVEAYTWEELGKISNAIATAETPEAANEIKQKYHLVNAAGTLDGTQVKSFTLNDGTLVNAFIIGFNHDDKADGTGKAGITFMFNSPVTEMPFNFSDSNKGGWKSSEIRRWLNEDLYAKFPEDLKAILVTANKSTNNAGKTKAVSDISATNDTLWLPASVEFRAPYTESELKEENLWCKDVYNAEGDRYEFFTANSDFQQFGSSKDNTWWLRTPSPGSAGNCLVVTKAGGLKSEKASTASAVNPCFCL